MGIVAWRVRPGDIVKSGDTLGGCVHLSVLMYVHLSVYFYVCINME